MSYPPPVVTQALAAWCRGSDPSRCVLAAFYVSAPDFIGFFYVMLIIKVYFTGDLGVLAVWVGAVTRSDYRIDYFALCSRASGIL